MHDQRHYFALSPRDNMSSTNASCSPAPRHIVFSFPACPNPHTGTTVLSLHARHHQHHPYVCHNICCWCQSHCVHDSVFQHDAVAHTGCAVRRSTSACVGSAMASPCQNSRHEILDRDVRLSPAQTRLSRVRRRKYKKNMKVCSYRVMTQLRDAFRNICV